MPEKPEKRMRTVCSCVGIPEACRPSWPATCACSLPSSRLPPRMFDFSICWPSEEGKKKSEKGAATAVGPKSTTSTRLLPLVAFSCPPPACCCCCSYCNHSSYTARPAPTQTHLHCRQRLPHTSRVVVRRVHILTPF